MGRPLRLFEPDAVQFATNRCFQAQFLLRPGTEVNEIVGSVVARALDRHRVTLYGFMAMSNHWHAELSGGAEAVAGFCGYVAGEIAKRVNKLWGREGPVFPRRYSASKVLDDEAAWNMLSYLYLNPVKADLCDTAAQWVGFSTLPESLGHPPRKYKYLDKAAYAAAKRRDPDARPEDFTTEHVLRVAPLPAYRSDRQHFAAKLHAVLRLGEAEYRKLRRTNNRPVSDSNHLLSLKPTARPRRPKKSRRPLCHTVCDKLRAAYRQAYRAFCDAFRLASEAFRQGEFDVKFPDHAFRPSVRPLARSPG